MTEVRWQGFAGCQRPLHPTSREESGAGKENDVSDFTRDFISQTSVPLTDGKRLFHYQMSILRQENGMTSVEQAYRAFALVVQWLRVSGHGSVTLSAIDHRFSNKIKAESVLCAEDGTRKKRFVQ